MEPMSRKTIAKKVAGFHSRASHDFFLGAVASGTDLFSRRRGFGIRPVQKEGSAMRRTVETERAVAVARMVDRAVVGDRRTLPVICRALFENRRSMLAVHLGCGVVGREKDALQIWSALCLLGPQRLDPCTLSRSGVALPTRNMENTEP